ncbi:MAG: YraN family protein [Thermoflavifilum sp.]|nr:YraN family protein [Thermoflavifilum sp.]MCL6513364.1 YraN family protein [Alicyclobacillus sp.]
MGRTGEDAAVQYLQRSLGWSIVDRNWRCQAGELDIIARDGMTLVLVEVRTRWSSTCDEALASVDERKQHQLRRVAGWYLGGAAESMDVRIDVVGVAWRDGVLQDLVHVRSACLM